MVPEVAVPRRAGEALKTNLIAAGVLPDQEKIDFYSGKGHEVLPNPLRKERANVVLVATRYVPRAVAREQRTQGASRIVTIPSIVSVDVLGQILDGVEQKKLPPYLADKVVRISVPGLVYLPGTAPIRGVTYTVLPFRQRDAETIAAAIMRKKQETPHWGLGRVGMEF
jgi:hypothetical protein